MTDHSREAALADIRTNIEKSGHHVYLILAEEYPRFAYTIGLNPVLGYELLFAGGADYANSEAVEILNVVAERIPASGLARGFVMPLGDLGSFSFREVHPSWANELMLGALDYFGIANVAARQIVPDEAHWTIDVPDTSVEWNPQSEPVWKCMHEPWTLPFSPDCTVTTNLAALRGARVTEAFRREEDQWEMFAGASNEIDSESKRDVTLATLFIADATLLPVTALAVGAGLRRLTPEGPWSPWN
jgi:hypothetical protein